MFPVASGKFKKIKELFQAYQEVLFLVLTITMVGFIGFGLGRLSAKYQNAELNIKSTLVNQIDLNKIIAGKGGEAKKDLTASAEKVFQPTTKSDTIESSPVADREMVPRKIVGNKNSKIYHFEDCPGALKMSESNKVLFDSIASAKKAGYRPAGNCPGLE